jgi:hypothetical protein
MRETDYSVAMGEILRSGLDDWVSFAEVDHIVRELTRDNDQQSRVLFAVEAISRLLVQQQIVIGSVDAKRGFVPWGLPLAEAVARLRDEALSVSREFWPGDVCWLSVRANAS